MQYAYSRDEVVSLLREYADQAGRIRLSLIEEVLLASAVSDRDVAWAYRKARALGMLPADMALDPRTVQLLAMDT